MVRAGVTAEEAGEELFRVMRRDVGMVGRLGRAVGDAERRLGQLGQASFQRRAKARRRGRKGASGWQKAGGKAAQVSCRGGGVGLG